MLNPGWLELHAANACNLTCESCAHFSNSGHAGILSMKDAAHWMIPWSVRLQPSMFRILGGEPTINPNLTELLYLSRNVWPKTPIALVTNGWFLHRHPELPKALKATGAMVSLTVHGDTEAYRAKLREILDLLVSWQVEFHLDHGANWWTRRHLGFGAEVTPYADGDPARSWRNCVCRTCRQLFRGKLWKCSPVAYLQLQKEAHPSISAAWDRYLGYNALEPSCTDAELAAFLGRREEAVCAMCPAEPEAFAKPDPLIARLELRKSQ
jgi:hypothetical protein